MRRGTNQQPAYADSYRLFSYEVTPLVPIIPKRYQISVNITTSTVISEEGGEMLRQGYVDHHWCSRSSHIRSLAEVQRRRSAPVPELHWNVNSREEMMKIIVMMMCLQEEETEEKTGAGGWRGSRWESSKGEVEREVECRCSTRATDEMIELAPTSQ